MKTLFLWMALLPSACFGAITPGTATSVFGTDPAEKFSFHLPTYFVFGKDDLKLQFSFKYRMARNFNLYFAFTELLFWDIYEDSKPFRDINYNPELFYRVAENSRGFFRSGDVGFMHHSNGKDKEDSRSLDKLFLRLNLFTKVRRHDLGAIMTVYHIYNEDLTNTDVVKHFGYWETTFFFTDLLRHGKQQLNLELKAYAGDKVINLDQGAWLLGFVYKFNSENFNPSIYFQRFEGFAENLLGFDKSRTEYRLGLMLSF